MYEYTHIYKQSLLTGTVAPHQLAANYMQKVLMTERVLTLNGLANVE